MANLNLSQFTEKTFVEDADWTFVWDTAGSISKKVSRNNWLNSGTLTTSAPVTISQTWNNAAVNFNELYVRATDTASGASSNLLYVERITSLGVSKPLLSLDKLGVLNLSGSTESGGLTFSQYGILTAFNWQMRNSNGYIGLGATSTEADTRLYRDTNNTLALRNGGAAQTFNVYNTYSNAGADYERSSIGWSGSRFQIALNSSGTGSGARNIDIGTQGTGEITFFTGNVFRWVVKNAGHFLASADDTYDIGTLTTNRPRAIYTSRYFYSGTDSGYAIASKAVINSPSDGVIKLNNWAINDFNRLQFGGTTASFPAIKRNGTGLDIVLANDTGFAPIKGKLTTDTAFTSGAITDTGYIVLYDSTGTAYKVACTPV